MIIDKLNNIGVYKGISRNLDLAIECIENIDFYKQEDGRYYLDGDNVYYTVTPSKPTTFENSKYESHKRYVDIQIPLVSGETMEFASAEDMEGWEEYDAQKDIRFLRTSVHGVPVQMDAGMFCILFPNDAHRCGLYPPEIEQGHKVVFKVKL